MTRYLIRFEDGAASIVEADRIVSFEERANQYLAERSIDVLYADGEYVAALCQGYSKTYRLGFETQRGWWCSCRIQGECPHLMALKSVVGTTQESPRKAEVEAESRKARARLRSAMEDEPEFVAQRAGSERVPELQAELADLRERVDEVPDLRTALEQARLEGQKFQAELKARVEDLGRQTGRTGQAEQALKEASAKRRELEAEIERVRSEAARLPKLESELQNQALRLSGLKADMAQKLSQHRLELMERDIKVNELQMEIQRLRARAEVLPPRSRRTATSADGPADRHGGPSPAAGHARAPAPAATSGWTNFAVPGLSQRNGEGAGAEVPESEPA
jgi:TolA-binding protein